MKTFLKCMYEAAGRNNKLANYMNTYNTSIHNIEPLLNEAAEIYAKQSNSHKPVVGGPVSDVRSEGEQLGNEGSAKSVRVECPVCGVQYGHAFNCSLNL